MSGGRKYIAIEADKKSFWHYCDDDGTPVEETILTGYIKRIERRDGDYPKLHIFVEADYEYVLVSGFSTHFSRQAMAAIASMSSGQLSLPVVIKPDLGKDDAKAKGKRPVFCNIIQEGHTIRSGQLGTRDAEELYEMAIAAFQGDKAAKPKLTEVPSVPTKRTVRKPSSPLPTASNAPSLDLPPIPPMKTPSMVTSQSKSRVKTESVDWKAFCQQHGIFPGVLKSLAQELGLPMGKLNPSQSAKLYTAAWNRFVEHSA
ncbi:MAG: hypothetical protein AAGB01_08280 [Cyanobacteria bacterium P01_F01_bin.42]